MGKWTFSQKFLRIGKVGRTMRWNQGSRLSDTCLPQFTTCDGGRVGRYPSSNAAHSDFLVFAMLEEAEYF